MLLVPEKTTPHESDRIDFQSGNRRSDVGFLELGMDNRLCCCLISVISSIDTGEQFHETTDTDFHRNCDRNFPGYYFL
jgi:hypothetical protein